MDEAIFFGPLDQVENDLKKAQQINAQAQITHAKDGETLAILRNKEQIIKQLLNHDLATVAVYPNFVTGGGSTRFDCCPTIAFQMELKVSIRGEATGEAPRKAIHILLPPGVRL